MRYKGTRPIDRKSGTRWEAYGLTEYDPDTGKNSMIYLGTYKDEEEAGKTAAAWRVAHRASTDPVDLALAKGVEPLPFKPDMVQVNRERRMKGRESA
jgi:hypothetical protein